MTTVESQPFRPTAPTTNKCGPNAGYAIFNNSGAGYTAATAKCLVKLTLASGDVPNANYSVMWRLSGTSFNCFQDEADAVQKSFVSVVGKKYVFTAYFKPGQTPQNNESATLTVNWQ